MITQRTRDEQQERQAKFDHLHEMGASLSSTLNPYDDLWDDNGLALLYSVPNATRIGGNPIRFGMSVEDARKFCSDKRTGGKGYTYCWTMVENYMATSGGILCKRYVQDNGMYDDIIDELGCEKIDKDELFDMLTEWGYKVK